MTIMIREKLNKIKKYIIEIFVNLFIISLLVTPNIGYLWFGLDIFLEDKFEIQNSFNKKEYSDIDFYVIGYIIENYGRKFNLSCSYRSLLYENISLESIIIYRNSREINIPIKQKLEKYVELNIDNMFKLSRKDTGEMRVYFVFTNEDTGEKYNFNITFKPRLLMKKGIAFKRWQNERGRTVNTWRKTLVDVKKN